MFKKIISSPIRIILLIAILGGIGYFINHEWRAYSWQRKVKNFMAAVEKPYREDTYGGKTPEETWEMFLDALKREDVEEASRYMIVEKQEVTLERLKEGQKLERLGYAYRQFSQELKKEGADYLQGEKAYYYISMKQKNGTAEAYPIVFSKNQFTKVWKISSL